MYTRVDHSSLLCKAQMNTNLLPTLKQNVDLVNILYIINWHKEESPKRGKIYDDNSYLQTIVKQSNEITKQMLIGSNKWYVSQDTLLATIFATMQILSLVWLLYCEKLSWWSWDVARFGNYYYAIQLD